jgi:DNA-binding response OmpR family regulator
MTNHVPGCSCWRALPEEHRGPWNEVNAVMMPSTPERRERVLIVEDERSTARLLEFILRKEGYEVAVASDGEQALCLADDFAPDAILLDLQLPGLSGVEVLSQIRQDRTRRQPAVIILTGTSFEIRPEETLLAGAQARCTKPIAPSTLIRKLREVRGLVAEGGAACLQGAC